MPRPASIAAALALCVLSGALSLGCRRGEGAPAPEAPPGSEAAAPEPEPEPLDLPLAWSRLPLLPPGVRPSGWSSALTHWRTATTAYSAGEMTAASSAFADSAAALRVPNEGREARVAATGRCLAYENAARALEANRDRGGARDLLAQAAANDAACKHSMALRLSRLELTSTSSRAAREAGTP